MSNIGKVGGGGAVEGVEPEAPARGEAPLDAAPEASGAPSRSKMIGGSTAFRGGFQLADLNAKLEELESAKSHGSTKAGVDERLAAAGRGGAPAGSGAAKSKGKSGTGPGESPLGVTYSLKAEGNRKDAIFGANGKLDAAKVLNSFTQIDASDATIRDTDRCGPQTAVAAAVMSKDPATALTKLAQFARDQDVISSDADDELAAIQGRIKSNTATLADLNFIADQLFLTVAFNQKGVGMSQSQLSTIYKAGGLGSDFEAAMVDTGGPGGAKDGAKDHFVLKGKTPDGKAFYYDPMPLAGKDQVYLEGSEGYKKYDAAAK